MTQQEIFDKVATHLLKQNRKSINEIGDCAYRGDNGLKCAIGCLIPDDKYTPSMEGIAIPITYPSLHDVNYVIKRKLMDTLKEIVELEEFSLKLILMDRLQYIHDRERVSDWFYKLDMLSSDCGLSNKILEDFR